MTESNSRGVTLPPHSNVFLETKVLHLHQIKTTGEWSNEKELSSSSSRVFLRNIDGKQKTFATLKIQHGGGSYILPPCDRLLRPKCYTINSPPIAWSGEDLACSVPACRDARSMVILPWHARLWVHAPLRPPPKTFQWSLLAWWVVVVISISSGVLVLLGLMQRT